MRSLIPMRFADLADSELARRIGLGFCRYAPAWLGHLVARAMRSILIRYMPELHLAVEQNLRQALGARVSDAEIQSMARWTVGHYTRASFDFFSTAAKGREAILAAVRVPRAGGTLTTHRKQGRSSGRKVALMPVEPMAPP